MTRPSPTDDALAPQSLAADTLAPLRRDVRDLGAMLGQVLDARGGDGLLDCVEQVRQLSKAAQAGDVGAGATLEALLAQLSPARSLEVARAFAQFLELANVAEQHHRVRRRRAWRAKAASVPQPASVDDAVGRLLAAGVSATDIHAALCSQQIELVLTAHPTQVQRRTIMRVYQGVSSCWPAGTGVTSSPKRPSPGSTSSGPW